MTFLYVTTKNYPATTADHVYIRELSRAFTSMSGLQFTLLVNKNTGQDLASIPHSIIDGGKRFRLLSMVFLFLKPRGSNLRRSEVFFSNDFNITLMLLFLKRIGLLKGKIAFDAHLMTRTWKDRYLFNHVDIVFSTSDVLKEHIYKILSRKTVPVHTILGGVDLEAYSKISAKQIQTECIKHPLLQKNPTVIGYIGGFKSLGHEKGLKTMIDSLTVLPQQYVCLFVGGHALEIEEYKLYARLGGVEERCIFIEKVDFSEVPLFQMLCDILAIPYPDKPHFADFGFPMKAFEYLASGKPIVYSKLKIMDEVLGGMGTSFIPDDYHSFAEAVRSADSTKHTSVPRALAAYTWNHKTLEIFTILQQQ